MPKNRCVVLESDNKKYIQFCRLRKARFYFILFFDSISLDSTGFHWWNPLESSEIVMAHFRSQKHEKWVLMQKTSFCLFFIFNLENFPRIWRKSVMVFFLEKKHLVTDRSTLVLKWANAFFLEQIVFERWKHIQFRKLNRVYSI